MTRTASLRKLSLSAGRQSDQVLLGNAGSAHRRKRPSQTPPTVARRKARYNEAKLTLTVHRRFFRQPVTNFRAHSKSWGSSQTSGHGRQLFHWLSSMESSCCSTSMFNAGNGCPTGRSLAYFTVEVAVTGLPFRSYGWMIPSTSSGALSGTARK